MGTSWTGVASLVGSRTRHWAPCSVLLACAEPRQTDSSRGAIIRSGFATFYLPLWLAIAYSLWAPEPSQRPRVLFAFLVSKSAALSRSTGASPSVSRSFWSRWLSATPLNEPRPTKMEPLAHASPNVGVRLKVTLTTTRAMPLIMRRRNTFREQHPFFARARPSRSTECRRTSIGRGALCD